MEEGSKEPSTVITGSQDMFPDSTCRTRDNDGSLLESYRISGSSKSASLPDLGVHSSMTQTTVENSIPIMVSCTEEKQINDSSKENTGMTHISETPSEESLPLRDREAADAHNISASSASSASSLASLPEIQTVDDNVQETVERHALPEIVVNESQLRLTLSGQISGSSSSSSQFSPLHLSASDGNPSMGVRIIPETPDSPTNPSDRVSSIETIMDPMDGASDKIISSIQSDTLSINVSGQSLTEGLQCSRPSEHISTQSTSSSACVSEISSELEPNTSQSSGATSSNDETQTDNKKKKNGKRRFGDALPPREGNTIAELRNVLEPMFIIRSGSQLRAKTVAAGRLYNEMNMGTIKFPKIYEEAYTYALTKLHEYRYSGQLAVQWVKQDSSSPS